MRGSTICDRCGADNAIEDCVWIKEDWHEGWFDLCQECFAEVLAILPNAHGSRRLQGTRILAPFRRQR